jgi:hypothetical protein
VFEAHAARVAQRRLFRGTAAPLGAAGVTTVVAETRLDFAFRLPFAETTRVDHHSHGRAHCNSLRCGEGAHGRWKVYRRSGRVVWNLVVDLAFAGPHDRGSDDDDPPVAVAVRCAL